MAQGGSTHDGPDRAPRSPWARSALPQSPWQPDAVGSIETPTDGLSVVAGPTGPTAPGDVIDIAPPDDDDFIDLGDHNGNIATDAARLGSSPWRSLEWRAHMRPFALVIVVVAALLVGGSVAPPLARLARLGSITVPLGAALATDGTRAMVLGSRDGTGESIAAYNVAGGARDWFTELSIRQADDVHMTVTDGVIIVSAGRLGNRGPHTVVVDQKTGHTLWSTAEDLLNPRRGSDALLMSNGPTEIMSRDKRTGAVRWVHALASGCSADLAVPADPDAPTALVELCLYSGALSRFNLNTGEPEITGHVSLTAAKDVDVTMFTVNDFVVVEDAGDHPPRFDTYRLDDLKPLWTRAPGFSPDYNSYPCGVEICVSAGGSTVILDTRTGAVIPSTGHEAELSNTLLQPFVPASKVGTLLLPAPGATVPLVNRVTYVADFAADDKVVPLPLFRPGRTWIVTLSPSGARDAVQLLVGPAADVCRPIGSYLGCMTAKNTLTFWTLPKIR
jgi:hypothetical protein